MSPEVIIDGVTYVSRATSTVAVVGDIEVSWGQESILAEPEPATLRMTLIWRDSVNEFAVRLGSRIEVRQLINGELETIFAGRVKTMRAVPDASNRLRMTITAADSLSELRRAFVATEWPADNTAGTRAHLMQLRGALLEAGWALTEDLPAPEWPSADTYYDSITLWTLIRRYTSQYGPQVSFWDVSSYQPDGTFKQVLHVGWMGRVQGGDALVMQDGRLAVHRSTPAGLNKHHLSAGDVLRDATWTANPDAMVTTAKVSRQVTRIEEDSETGETRKVTSLEDVTTSVPAAEVYGARPVELESSALASRAHHRAIGRRWIEFGAHEWTPGEVTLPRTKHLSEEVLAGLLSTSRRRRAWWIVEGIQAPMPIGGMAALRGVATGGTLRWDAPRREWNVSMAITDTQIIRPVDMSFADLAAGPPAIAAATADQGGRVAFADFRTISHMKETP